MNQKRNIRNPVMKSPWLHLIRQATGRSGKHIFGFPYAGGSITSLRPLGEFVAPDTNLYVASLPGRSLRFGEAPVTRLPTLVNALAQAIEQTLPKDFVLYGHSMGGILAFEIARELRRRNHPPPKALVVSGVSAPQLFGKPPSEHRYNLPHDDFIDYLKELEGTPTEVLEHPELMEMMLPILRADFEICDTYRLTEDSPLDIPIHALFGKEDHAVGQQGMQAWSAHTCSDFRFSEYEGGHFFINDHWADIAGVLDEVNR